MGCQSSRNVSVEEPATTSNKTQEKKTYFTELQIDFVRSTWPLLAKDKTKFGCDIFAEIFTMEPMIKDMFSFGNLDTDDIHSHPAAKGHAKKFMDMIEHVCEHMEEVDDPDNDATRRLVLLGAKHAALKNIDLRYFHIFNKCAHIIWEQILGEEYTVDLREAWNLLFEFIQEKIQDGFSLYMDDKEKENAQNGDLKITLTTATNNNSTGEKFLLAEGETS